MYIAADMAETADADRVVEFAEEQLKELDYIVLNHIGPSPYAMWDGDVDHIRWLMQVRQHSRSTTQKSARYSTLRISERFTLHNPLWSLVWWM